MNKQKHWLVIGVVKNWDIALSQPVPIWGLRSRYQAEFQALNIGDIIWFYVTSPVSGIIGLGTIRDKYADNTNLVWPDEISRKEVIWPLRFRIQVLKVISKNRWKTDCIKINDFHLNWQVGFQLLQEMYIALLIKRSEKVFNVEQQEDFFQGPTIPQPLALKDKSASYITSQQNEKALVSHRSLQNTIAEIGKLQFYHTELEFPIELPGEDKNLDVVWKREITGVPSFVFEVELSGVIEKAITRLKFAYRKWNSRPRIVVPKEFYSKVRNIIAVENRDFLEQFKMYEPIQIIELLNKKRELKNMEQNLEIY